MKKTFFLLVSLITVSELCAQVSEWRNPAIPAVNIEYPVTGFMSYTSRENAVKNDYSASPYYNLLNGVWKHKRFPSVMQLDSGVFSSNYNDSGWEDMQVPQKKSEHLQEVNSTAIPEDVSVDIFRTELYVPFAWADKQIFIGLEEAWSGVFVYVNGQKAGYAEDSKNPAVYDVTTLLKEGNNVLVIAATGWSTGSQLEEGRGIHGKIIGSVYVKALPKIRVRDFEIQTNLTNDYKNGVLDFGVIVKTHLLNTKSVKVYFELFSPEGNLLESASKEVELGMRQEQTVHFDVLIPDVQAWSSELPALYTVMTRIQREGSYTEYVERKVGFRSVENRGGEFLFNGKPIYIRGINIGEFPTGRAEMAEALQWMKRHNINAIRTEQSPQSERFYELCDEYGFYVLSEANVDSREFGFAPETTLGNNPAYLNAHLGRVQTVYERTKNYASVVMFSLGDKGGNGYNFYETYLWLKSREKMRPIVYADAGREWNTDAVFISEFDQAGYEKERQMPSPRPYFFIGYNTERMYWRGVHPEVRGGFILRWHDKMEDNSLIREMNSPVSVSLAQDAKPQIVMTNQYDFISLERFDFICEIFDQGKSVLKEIIPCTLSPGEEGVFDLPVPRKKGNDYRLTLMVREPFGGYYQNEIVEELRFSLHTETLN